MFIDAPDYDDIQRFLAEPAPGAPSARGISASDLQRRRKCTGLSGTILAVHVSRRLRSLAYTAALRRIVTIVRRGAALANDVAVESVRAFVRNRRRHAYLRSLHSLNDNALKDIGLHRSEISSVVRELVDDVPPSRVRTASTRVSTMPCAAKPAANNERLAGQVASAVISKF